MDTLQVVLGIIYVIVCIGLILTVFLQESKSKGLGALTGDSSDTFYGKTKKRTKDAVLARLSVVFAISFAILSMVLYLLTGRGI
ncbi:MAG TPA: preprotein translocase subunit SecG [Fastidiosipila sp.]|jgi:preprotein translocase subunit SecG|nr:preprotein translocase subunit SecG [Eubacteriales bacterium]MDD3611940.1 preprotein translocase subunit SecG [Eubacteriales bacterium]HHU04426.1 preprotein translocase subunit SecG [Fastidiosipila sp.]